MSDSHLAQTIFPRRRYYPRRKVYEANRMLAASSHPVILTGAGISAGSGVPTFRGGRASLWKNRELMKFAEHGAFLRDPQGVWSAHERLRAVVERCAPNAAHKALARICERQPGTRVFTQNVDGLHEESGVAAFELHGSLRRFVCISCGCVRRAYECAPVEFGAVVCWECGGRLRHDTALFGESVRHLDQAIACLEQADLVLFVGTSGKVTPTRDIALAMKRRGTPVIEIDLAAFTSSSFVVHLHIRAEAELVLPDLTS